MKFLLRSPFDTLSGYGNDGVGIALALKGLGHDVHLFPSSVTPPVPEELAMMLVRWPDPPFDAVIVHVSPVDDTDAKVLRGTATHLILWTMWEYEALNVEGKDEVRDRLERSKYDLLLAYDEVTQMALDDPEVNPDIPIRILQGGYSPEFWAEADPSKRDWSGTFRFGMVGRLHNRKNPWAAIRAFGQLRDEHGDDFDAELHLKTTMGNIPYQVGERWPGIHVHYEWWNHEHLREFYESLHCYVATSTGEGKNLPALEAQTTGVPVIATDYGGHRGWLSSEYGYPLRFEREEYNAGPGAKADEEHLRELMWHVYTHRAEAREKGAIAARTIPPMMSWPSVMNRLVDLLQSWPVQEGRQHGRDDQSAVLGEPPEAPGPDAPEGRPARLHPAGQPG